MSSGCRVQVLRVVGLKVFQGHLKVQSLGVYGFVVLGSRFRVKGS